MATDSSKPIQEKNDPASIINIVPSSQPRVIARDPFQIFHGQLKIAWTTHWEH